MKPTFWILCVFVLGAAIIGVQPWRQPGRELAASLSLAAAIQTAIGAFTGAFVFWLHARRAYEIRPSQRAESMVASPFFGGVLGAMCAAFVCIPLVERAGEMAGGESLFFELFLIGGVWSSAIAMVFGYGSGQRPRRGRSD